METFAGRSAVSSSHMVDLVFLFHSLFLFFISVLFFYFSIFRIMRVRVDRSRCHISHNLMA